MEYGSLREKIAAESAARKSRYAKFQSAYNKAIAAGFAAGEAAIPAPMIVSGGMPGAAPKSYYVSEGVCGFAWVTASPGNSSFAKWLVKNKLASKHYGGGVSIWISQFNQSMTRKEAMAHKMADVLNAELAGEKVRIGAGSRMD